MPWRKDTRPSRLPSPSYPFIPPPVLSPPSSAAPSSVSPLNSPGSYLRTLLTLIRAQEVGEKQNSKTQHNKTGGGFKRTRAGRPSPTRVLPPRPRSRCLLSLQ